MFIFLDVPDLGLVLQWDEETRISLRLYPIWRNLVKGLCGNFDDNALNDFQTPSGGLTETNIGIFVDSWRTDTSCPKYKYNERNLDTCDKHPERKLWATERCAIIKSHVFAACHSEVEPNGYVDRCIFDACGCDDGGDCECTCTAIGAYAQECNIRGVPVRVSCKFFR